MLSVFFLRDLNLGSCVWLRDTDDPWWAVKLSDRAMVKSVKVFTRVADDYADDESM